MDKQINVLGYSIWIPDPPDDGTPPPAAPLYRPLAIALHTVVFGLYLGVLLYGLNRYRQGQHRLGITFLAIAGGLLALQLTVAPFGLTQLWLLNGLVAIALYQLESPHYAAAISRGGATARWWLPTLAGSFEILLAGAIAWFRG